MTAKKKLKRPTKKPKKKAKKKAAKRSPKSVDAMAARLEKATERAGGKLAKTPKKRGTYIVRASEIRQLAAVDYITDPDCRSIEFWYERSDRPYKRTVKLGTFREWAALDNWTSRRDKLWLEVEERIIRERAEQIMMRRLEEVDELTEMTSALAEYLRPMRDENGEVKRYPEGHKLEGLPMYPVELPPFDKLAKSWIDMHKQLMLKRGEATARSEQVGNQEQRVTALDPVGGKANLSPDDIKIMARQLILRRQPELADSEVIDVPDDVYGEDDNEEGEDNGD